MMDKLTVLKPAGDIAAQQGDLVVISTILMLIIVLPVMALTIFFAIKYRAGNKNAKYEPDWDHSLRLELIIWTAPLLIIICLGAITWTSTHLLDPYRKLGRISEGNLISKEIEPLEVNVVAMDWKWLFIYPKYNIATINELAVPANTPIHFRITASSVMNAFYAPALAGMIYAMPGMESKLHAVMNSEGDFRGISANYSGDGFSGMRFALKSMNEADFSKWAKNVAEKGENLDRSLYMKLEKPSENDPARYFRVVDTKLYASILNMCVEPGKMCMGEMMAIDKKGGLGLAGINNTLPLVYDKYARRGTNFMTSQYITSICATDEPKLQVKGPEVIAPLDHTPLMGLGLNPDALTGPSLYSALEQINMTETKL